MTTAFQKMIFISGLMTLLATCSMYCQSKYRIFSENRLGNYKLLYFVKDSDSILIIAKNKILTNKIENNIEKIVSGKIGNKISNLKADGQTFWFYYKMNSQYGLINSGDFSPGEVKKSIYTYRSFPIFIEKFP